MFQCRNVKRIALHIALYVKCCASPIGWYLGTHKSIILTSKKTPEQIWLVCAFSWRSNHRKAPIFLSDLHTAAPHIVTRPWPNWFFFSFNIPLELAFLSALWNKTSKRRRKTLVSALRGEAQKSAEKAQKEAPLWGYRKVKIINVDSIEALHTDKGGKTLHFGSADPHGVINSFKGAEIKREQHVSREGERGFQSGRQAWLLQGPFLLPAALMSSPKTPLIFLSYSAFITHLSVMLLTFACNYEIVFCACIAKIRLLTQNW